MKAIKQSIVFNKEDTLKIINMFRKPGSKQVNSIEEVSAEQQKAIEKYITKLISDSWKRMRKKNPIC